MTKTIRVIVADDSLTVQKHIVEVLNAAEGFEVIGEANNGKTAIELCEQLRPDVITMDMMMPVMTGMAATEYIMAYCPTPILIVSASTNRGEVFRTYDALAAGAVDVLEKPLGVEPDEDWEQRLISAVRMVSKIRVIRHPKAKLEKLVHQQLPNGSNLEVGISQTTPKTGPRLIALGASTGGPSALLNILSPLPKTFPLPILLVLHISEAFALAMAEWLDAQLNLPVRYAKDGELLPKPGESGVWMAPPGRHLEATDGRLRLSDAPERHSCKPSVDVLFESLARSLGPQTVACLLTGMGRDGAAGLLAVKNAGGITAAQDEASSVVFGMPGEAIKLGAARYILPLDEFTNHLNRAAASMRLEVAP